jgi:hypothetical protein
MKLIFSFFFLYWNLLQYGGYSIFIDLYSSKIKSFSKYLELKKVKMLLLKIFNKIIQTIFNQSEERRERDIVKIFIKT